MRSRSALTRTVSFGALLSSAAAIMPICGPAAAEDIDPLYCNAVYAQQAVKDAKVNQDWGCFPRNEPRWSTRFSDHYNYCTSGEPDKQFLEFERTSRNVQAGNCGYCNSAEAVSARADRVLYNKMYGCGFTGPDWSDDPRETRKACLDRGNGNPGVPAPTSPFLLCGVIGCGTRLYMVPQISKYREQELQTQVNQCKAKYDSQIVSSCEDYATQAMMLGSYNNGYHCGAEHTAPHGRFSTNWQFHFNWCIQPGNAQYRAGEQNARMTAVKQCMIDHGDTPDPNDLAFTPVRGGGYHSANNAPSKPDVIPPSYIPPSNGRIGIIHHEASPQDNYTPRLVPSPSQPANAT